MSSKIFETEAMAVERLCQIKGDNFIAYRKRWDRANRFEEETDFPLFLHIEANNHCNFHCPMCTQGIPELKEKFGYRESLTTENILAILREGQAYGCPSISFQGDNEPFLIKEMSSWFKLAAGHGFQDIMVNTNGSIMNEQLAEEIIESGLTRLRFSLDAVNEATYQKIRKGGTFAKTMQNIQLFLAKRRELNSILPMVGVNFVKMKENEAEINDFIDYWNERVDYIVIQDFMKPDTEGDYYSLSGVTQVSETTDFSCNQPWQRLYIRGNGEVTPCCAQFSCYLKLGEYPQSTLKELWDCRPAKELRKLHAEGRYYKNPICLKCSKSGGA
ncbi:MAG: radical SAM protein [Planctomycetes bacterium]|nr:radical SAM protein [Planctomycetota bacterium]